LAGGRWDSSWLFWVAPIAGALLAGLVYRWFEKDE
jgi:aquaporin Z